MPTGSALPWKTMVLGAASTAVILGILAVRHQPSSVEGDAPNPTNEPVAHDAKSETDVRQKAHRDALQSLLSETEDQLRIQVPWAFRRAGQDAQSTTPLPFVRSYESLETWRHLSSELSEIREDVLTPSQVVLLRTARHDASLFRALAEGKSSTIHDAMVVPHAVSKILDDLIARWVIDDDPISWRGPVLALGQWLQNSVELPATATTENLRAAMTTTDELTQRIARIRKESAQYLAAEWSAPLQSLEIGLQAHRERLKTALEKSSESRALGVDDPLPLRALGHLVRRRAYTLNRELFALWERENVALGLEPRAAIQGVEQVLERLHRIRKVYLSGQKKTPASVKLDCADAQAKLHAALLPNLSAEMKPIHCTLYSSLAAPISDAEQLFSILRYALIRPQRQTWRSTQAPLIVGTENEWSDEIQAELRAVMLLSAMGDKLDAPLQATLDTALRRLESRLCRAHVVLSDAFEPSLEKPTPPLDRCRPEDRAGAKRDPWTALSGVIVGQLPVEPYKMVAFDRYYWGPPGLALLWATPPGQHPDRSPSALPGSPSASPPEAPAGIQVERLTPRAAQDDKDESTSVSTKRDDHRDP